MYCLYRAQKYVIQADRSIWGRELASSLEILVVCLVTTKAQLKNLLTAQLWSDNYTTQLLDIHTLINQKNCLIIGTAKLINKVTSNQWPLVGFVVKFIGGFPFGKLSGHFGQNILYFLVKTDLYRVWY